MEGFEVEWGVLWGGPLKGEGGGVEVCAGGRALGLGGNSGYLSAGVRVAGVGLG